MLTTSILADLYFLELLPSCPEVEFLQQEAFDKYKPLIDNELQSIILIECTHAITHANGVKRYVPWRETFLFGNLFTFKGWTRDSSIIGSFRWNFCSSEVKNIVNFESANKYGRYIRRILSKKLTEKSFTDSFCQTDLLNFMIRDQNFKEDSFSFTYSTCMDLFQDYIFERRYGGENWIEFVKLSERVYLSTSFKDFVFALDRILDMVHNTGTFLDKFKDYHNLEIFVNIKTITSNIFEIWQKCSHWLKKELLKIQEVRNYLISTKRLLINSENYIFAEHLIRDIIIYNAHFHGITYHNSHYYVLNSGFKDSLEEYYHNFIGEFHDRNSCKGYMDSISLVFHGLSLSERYFRFLTYFLIRHIKENKEEYKDFIETAPSLDCLKTSRILCLTE